MVNFCVLQDEIHKYDNISGPLLDQTFLPFLPSSCATVINETTCKYIPPKGYLLCTIVLQNGDYKFMCVSEMIINNLIENKPINNLTGTIISSGGNPISLKLNPQLVF